MRQTRHALELAMYRCSLSAEELDSALLNLNAFEPSSKDTVFQTGWQLALDDLRLRALLDVLMNQN